MNLFDELKIRGLVQDHTDQMEMVSALRKGAMSLYCGFDPTADSLHIGNLVPITGLMRFQSAGHRPIALIGGGTGMIGDPSGKSEERNLLSAEILEHNLKGIRAQFERFLDFDAGSNSACMMNNGEWLNEIRLIDFFRDIGKHFPIGYMMGKESVKSRIAAEGISYTEFSYMALQAYDFLHLFEKENCTLQIGGSDQWGNITAGIELIRRIHGKPALGMTFPLITTSDGRKFGKTEEGNIWLDPKRTSPYRFSQYWIQTDDRDVGRFLRYFTFLSVDEIDEIEKEHLKTPEKRAGQHFLAKELTTFVHGSAAARSAERAAKILFGAQLNDIEKNDLLSAAEEMPKTLNSRALPFPLIDILLETGLSKSKTMARKELRSGGIYVNNHRITDEKSVLSVDDILFGQYILLRKGKKNYHLLEIER